MKKLILICAIGAGMLFAPKASAVGTSTLTDEEYAYITMDLQGILNLTMTTNPQVDFTFKTIQEYRNGIIKHNATKLEVDATVAWDLYVYAQDTWTQVEQYSTNGQGAAGKDLPCEILGIRCNNNPNTIIAGTGIGTPVNASWRSMLGKAESVSAGGPGNPAIGDPTDVALFLKGGFGVADLITTNLGGAPGTSAQNPDTHQFRIDYALNPGIPAYFKNVGDAGRLVTGAQLYGNLDWTANEYAAPGYYYLEVTYVLTEDL